MKKETYQFCPRCNSTDISPYYDTSAIGGFGSNFTQFQCNRCGNIGSFFPETDEKPEEKEIENEKNNHNTSKETGLISPVAKAYNSWTRYVWRIAGPMVFIGAIIIPFFEPDTIYLSIIWLIPFSISITGISFGKEISKKYRWLKNFIILLFILSITALPLVALYLFDKY